VIRLRTPRLVRPRSLDVGLTALCAALMHVERGLMSLPVFGFTVSAGIVVAALPVLLRRQAPVTALVLAFITLFGVMETSDIYNTIPLPAVLCAYTVADLRGRRAALVAAGGAVPLTLAILQYYSPHPVLSWGTAQNMALIALPLALGVAAHDRRAYTAALVERAQVAERNQEEMARRRVSEERLRIARDVHDVVAHAMVTINVQAGVGAYLIRTDPDEAFTNLRTIKQLSGDALRDLRSMLGILREGDPGSSAPGAPVQGISALDDLFESLRRAGLDLTVDIDPAARTLPTSVDTTAYRIVQEAMTNTLRHAGSTSARIRVSRTGNQVLVEVTDDGGVPTEQLRDSGSGNGLRGMRERSAAVGGSLEAGPRSGGGWQVTATLPVDQAARSEHCPTEVPAP
jgi:signal transduction histidine kinase